VSRPFEKAAQSEPAGRHDAPMPDSDAAFEEKAAKTIEQIGRRIAELRRKAGWSQKEFAEVLNSSVQ